MTPKAIIFDLDGTLIDSEILWCKALQKLIQSRNLAASDEYTQGLVYGRAWRDILATLRRDYPSITEPDPLLEAESQHHYNALHASVDIRIHSSIELLKSLARRLPVAIVSGSTRRQIATAITLMDIASQLSFYLGNEDYPRGKPDPSGFLMASERFGVAPSRCLVFEDSTAGVMAAKAAGMYCVALRRNAAATQDVSMADTILTDLGQFTLDA